MLASALLTASEVGKAFFISGCSTTTLLPCTKFFRYLPRTPLPNSSRFNSGMSWSAIFIDAFFISCCLSGANDSYAVAAFGMNYHQKPCLVGDSVCSTSIFEFAVIGVRKCQCQSVAKNGHRLVERYTVFQQIACSLLIIPVKREHAKHLEGLIGIGRCLAAPPSHTTGRTGLVSGGSLKLRCTHAALAFASSGSPIGRLACKYTSMSPPRRVSSARAPYR